MKTCAYKSVDHISIGYFSNKKPTNDEWNGYIDLIKNCITTNEFSLNVTFSEGQGPDANQRKQIINKVRVDFAAKKIRAILITESKIAKGMVTAMNWMGAKDIKVFKKADIDKGLDWLGIHDRKESIMDVHKELRDEVEKSWK